MNLNEVRSVSRKIESKHITIKCVQEKDLLNIHIYPAKTNQIIGYVILTEGKGKTFGHFLLIIKDSNHIMFFDSFALPLNIYGPNIRKFMGRHGKLKKVRWTSRIQHVNSLSCAAHVLTILSFIAKFKSIKRGCKAFNALMNKNLMLNDKFVVKFIYDHFKMKKPCKDVFCDPYNGTYQNCQHVCNFNE